ncbi:Protein of unknown function, partial [Gryllus bimaculatus]
SSWHATASPNLSRGTRVADGPLTSHAASLVSVKESLCQSIKTSLISSAE